MRRAPFTIYPAGGGGVHIWDTWSFSPKTGLIYFPTSISGTTYTPAVRTMTVYKDGPYNTGVLHTGAPTVGQPYQLAWDPAAHKQVWHSDVRGQGVISTAGGLVFQGGPDPQNGFTGQLWAVRADNGAKVWSFHTTNNISGSPISYAVDGKQYVAVLGGSGSGTIYDARAEQPGRIFVFALDGAAAFPGDPPKA